MLFELIERLIFGQTGVKDLIIHRRPNAIYGFAHFFRARVIGPAAQKIFVRPVSQDWAHVH